jgi:hypothetical protein
LRKTGVNEQKKGISRKTKNEKGLIHLPVEDDAVIITYIVPPPKTKKGLTITEYRWLLCTFHGQRDKVAACFWSFLFGEITKSNSKIVELQV